MTWYEIRVKRDANLPDLYASLGEYEMVHHFWDEPWWPGAVVVRVLTEDPSAFSDHPAVDHYVPWDSSEDERHYGDDWPQVAAFFQTSSALAMAPGAHDHFAAKMVHCFLNARCMSERDEARFAARFLWGRMTIKLRWRLYLKRRWERRQVAA